MPFVYHGSAWLDGKAKVDGGECVRLVQHFLPWVGHTSIWRPGERVLDILASGRKIEPGTAIATFIKGRFPTAGHRHAAFYEYEVNSCTYNPKLKRCAIMGIVMTDQWNASPNSPYPKDRISSRTVRPYGKNSPVAISDNADNFYILE